MFKKKPAILNQDSDTMCFNHAELGEFNLIQHESSSKTALAEIERLIKDNDGRDAKTIVVDYLLDKVMPKHFKFFMCEGLLHALWVYGDGLYCERVILDPDSEFLTMYNLLLGRYSPFPLKDDVAFNKLNATKMNCKLNKVFAAVFKRRQGSVFQGCVIYDLGDAKVAEITEEGVKVVPNTFTQVIFKSVNRHYEQPYPDFENANHELLFRYINLHGEEQQLLLTAALCYTIAGEEGYPVLFFTGDAGSGKTEGCRFCTSLIDNGADTIRRLTRKEEDLKLGCFNRHVVAYDNVTSLTAVLQELMCICVTGGSVATRMLYENTKEQVIRLNNPLFLTSINMPELQADLVDRSIVLKFERLTNAERMTKANLYDGFSNDAGSILGGLLLLISKAMKVLKTFKPETTTRLADFSTFGQALAIVLGKTPEDFLKAYLKSEDEMSIDVVEGDIVLTRLMDFVSKMESDEWIGTAATLSEKLKPGASIANWPKDPSAFGRLLRKYKTTLMNFGVETQSTTAERKRALIVKRLPHFVAPMPSQQPPGSQRPPRKH